MSDPRTVKVRIAVAVEPSGKWSAYGSSGMDPNDAHDLVVDDLHDGEARYWITAELPLPEVREVEGEVADA